MKKLYTVFLCLIAANAMANEYDTYIEYDAPAAEYPICKCDTNASRDNYVGFRLYKNQHSAFSFKLPNEHAHKETRDNFGFGTTMGNRLTENIRVEYETLYMGAQYSKDNTDFDYDIWANMLNAYLFKSFGHAVEPYVGAGIGLTGIWGEINGELDNAFDLSGQAMIGILFRLNSRIDLDVGFKYIYFGKVEHSRGTSKVDATQFYIGGTYAFGM